MRILNTFLLAGLIILFPLIAKAQTPALEPIVLVPGILGSYNADVILKNKTGQGTWDFPPLDNTWDNMIDALEKAGYEKDKTLLIAFYDWRQSNINSATDYLIPTIDKALLNSPTGKVDIIAHSMGGLVARRYVQSVNYRNDVDQLIMLGTPNYGSSDVYTLWEGGEVPSNWEKTVRYYISYVIDINNIDDITIDDEYDTIHKYFPSVRELLPVYDFLVDSDGNKKSYRDLTEAKNFFLENLNFSGTGVRLRGLGGLTVIAGKGEGTVGDIIVAEQPASETKLWKDGIPEPFPPERNNTSGDNRVLLSSALLNEFLVFPPVLVQNFWQKLFAKILPIVHAQSEDIDDFLKQKEIDSKHGDLPTTAISEVFATLALPQPTIAYEPPTEPDNITSFWFASPVEVKITDPQGRMITKDMNQIPEAVYTGETDPNGVKIIIIPNGLPGQYQIELIGQADGEYHMAVSNFTNDTDNIVTTKKSVIEGEKIEYTATIDSQTGSPIEISEPIITNPEEPPIEKSVTELLNDLLIDVQVYYELGQINNESIYKSLTNDLKKALTTLQKVESTEHKIMLAKKKALAKLHLFISRIEKQNNKKHQKIDPGTALDLINKAQAIIVKIN